MRISPQVIEATQGIAYTAEAVTHPSDAIDDLMLSEDMIEGLTAFAHERKPRWRNR